MTLKIVYSTLSAKDCKADYIITRDPKGFTRSNIPVLSPEELCQKLKL